MVGDTTLRTLYRLAERVEGEELARVQAAIARRRTELSLEELAESPLSAAAAVAPGEPEAWTPPSARHFRPAARGEVPRLIRRPGERKNRVAPPSA